MCGIMGAVSHRDISNILLEGLKRLEYRGYDSAGIAVIDAAERLKRRHSQKEPSTRTQNPHKFDQGSSIFSGRKHRENIHRRHKVKKII